MAITPKKHSGEDIMNFPLPRLSQFLTLSYLDSELPSLISAFSQIIDCVHIDEFSFFLFVDDKNEQLVDACISSFLSKARIQQAKIN